MTHFRSAVIIALIWTAPLAAQAPKSTESEVLAVVNAVFDGMRKVDSAMVRPLFHPKARMITVDSRNPDAQIEESVEGLIRSMG